MSRKSNPGDSVGQAKRERAVGTRQNETVHDESWDRRRPVNRV
jgi:hypothetical protein